MLLLKIPRTEKTFGAALKWARLQRGLTQKQVAEKAKLIVTFYCAVEGDKRHTERLDTLAKVLGVEVGELQDRAGLTQDLIQWLKQKPHIVRRLWRVRRSK
jgi:transcriptional regulator with XRE-family HTH domain